MAHEYFNEKDAIPKVLIHVSNLIIQFDILKCVLITVFVYGLSLIDFAF